MSALILQNFSVTLVIFYYAYLVLVGIYLIVGFFCVYHLVRFGFLSAANISIILIFVLVSVWLVGYSLTILSGFDWSLPLIDPNWFNSLNNLNGSLINTIDLPAVKF